MAQFAFGVPKKILTSQKSQTHHRAFRRAPALKGKRPGYSLGLRGVTLPRWLCLGEVGGSFLAPGASVGTHSYLPELPRSLPYPLFPGTECSTPQCGHHQSACWLEIIQERLLQRHCTSTQPYPAPTTPVITLITKERWCWIGG